MNMLKENQAYEGSQEGIPAGSAVSVQPHPGRQEYYNRDPRRKSPGLAALLSAMPGLGQVYLGYYQQGFINILVVASLIGLLNLDLEELAPLLGFFLAFFWLYNMIDAARRASLYNHALVGLDPFSVPEETAVLGTQGSLAGGLLLVFFGLLFFAHTMFEVSLEWIEDWWPMALIFVGAYLIYKHFADRPAA